MGTNDPSVFTALTNLLRVWAFGNSQVPAGFAERASVTAVSRQPVVYASVDLERCERQTQETFAPLPDGAPVDAADWPTQDVFALMPAAPAAFVITPQTRRVALPGRQEARQCVRCRGQGATHCGRCESGQVACPSCNGALRVACPRCGGAGSHLGVSGRMIQCRQCNTRGTVQCDFCNRRGAVTCSACAGSGTISCDPCAGHGRVVRGWDMIEMRRTETHRTTHVARIWGNLDTAFEQSEVVAERVYLNDRDAPLIDLDRLAPEVPQAQISQLLRESLAAHAAERRAGTATDRIAAVRVRLRGLFAYEVTVKYDGNDYTVLVTAGGAVIIPKRLPAARRGPIASVGRLFGRYFRALQTDETPGPQREFIRAVRGGRAHIADERCVVPQAAALLGVQAEVTEAGYCCHVRTPGELTIAIGIDIRFELSDSDTCHLCVDLDLGPAHRDRLTNALAASHSLPAGRLAVVNGPKGEEILRLVDRHPYDTADAGQYAAVLRLLAIMARELRGRSDLF
jgi:hypothetical protein